MSTLLARVRRYAAEHELWAPGARVVAAVSGGSDSVALLFLLHELSAAGELTLAGLVHVHHHVRGAEADADAAFCRALAARLGVPAVVVDADVPARAAREGVSIEVAGREARQDAYAEACAALDATRVALAHTRDDQAETLLLRLVRGAGATGLAGMAPRSGARVRPVLAVSRAELRDHLRARGESWRDDRTNDDRANPRNRLRHDVLPLLADAFNPNVAGALARAADLLRADDEALAWLANDAASRIVLVDGGRVMLERAGLNALPVALARRVARRALETANPRRSYGLEEVDAVRRLAAGSAASSLPGLSMERSAAQVVLTTGGRLGGPGEGRLDGPAGLAAFEVVLPVPGEVNGPGGRWRIVAEARRRADVDAVGSARGGDEAWLDLTSLRPPLVVRGRRAGDRLRPLGSPGRRKLQDVFVDRKVPRDERDLVPVVTDETGQIVWVAGHVTAEPFRVTPLTTTVVVLTLRRA